MVDRSCRSKSERHLLLLLQGLDLAICMSARAVWSSRCSTYLLPRQSCAKSSLRCPDLHYAGRVAFHQLLPVMAPTPRRLLRVPISFPSCLLFVSNHLLVLASQTHALSIQQVCAFASAACEAYIRHLGISAGWVSSFAAKEALLCQSMRRQGGRSCTTAYTDAMQSFVSHSNRIFYSSAQALDSCTLQTLPLYSLQVHLHTHTISFVCSTQEGRTSCSRDRVASGSFFCAMPFLNASLAAASSALGS